MPTGIGAPTTVNLGAILEETLRQLDEGYGGE